MGEGSHIEWSKTYDAIERVKRSPFYEEATPENRHGKFQGRAIIGRDTPINMGVYLGGGEREAIVVDDVKQVELYKAYQEFLSQLKAKEEPGKGFKEHVLSDALSFARERLKYDDKQVERIIKPLEPDQKIGLDSFLEKNVGICRHQALFAGYLLEKLKSEGYVSGTVSVDRNFIPGEGGHAWVRYTNSVGDIFIIDPAQRQSVIKLEDSGNYGWNYRRPGDKK